MTHWTWHCEAPDGSVPTLDFEEPDFPSQSDAESWLGEVWRQLADGGVSQVSLYEDDRLVYGPMSLEGDGSV